MPSLQKHLPTILAVYIAFVFLQSLAFKFTGSEETVIIFSTIGQWMADIGLPERFANGFAEWGGIVVGIGELVASILVLVPRTRVWGALLGWFVMSGAIFFHLFTPLGVNRVIDASGATDGGVLFMMACGVWLGSLVLIYQNRQRLPLHRYFLPQSTVANKAQ